MTQRKFTLVELLIVIGIIAVLSGLLLPVVGNASKKAEMAKANSEMTTLLNAIKQYESTYGTMPIPKTFGKGGSHENEAVGGGNPDDDNDAAKAFKWLVMILQGEDPGSTLSAAYGKLEDTNRRKQKFLDISGNEPGLYTDPWDRNYYIRFDVNYDGKIPVGTSDTSIDGLKSGVDNLYFDVVLWSKGPDKKSSSTANDKTNHDNIYSFNTLWSNNDGHSVAK